ncbi:MAG: SurA N-terminal domain-containing protein [Candidatus Woesearchaeota archaeon]
MVRTKYLLVAIAMVALLLVTGCGVQEGTDKNADEIDIADEIDSEPEQPNETPSVSGAVVNGEEVDSEEITSMQEMLKSQGQEISEEDILEELINQELLMQEVEKQGLSVSDEKAESEIEEQLSAQGANIDDYKQQLELQGMSYDDELENVKEQLAVNKLLEEELEGEEFEITEEQAQDYYDQYTSSAPEGEEVPEYEEIESQIKAELEQQQMQEARNSLVEELRAEADISYE